EVIRAERAHRRSKIVSVRRSAQGCDQAASVQGVRHRVHARAAARRADGVVGGRVRRAVSVREARVMDGGRTKRAALDAVTMAHGGGGRAMRRLIDEIIVPAFDNPLLAELEDQARIAIADLARAGDRLAFTTDSYVVTPLEFAGGDIGKLAVCGTINDLAVSGAKPLFLSCGLV